MHYSLLFIIFFSISIYDLAGQSIYPAGGYKNIDELRSRSPSIHSAFHPISRSKEQILFIGGNDYFMESMNEAIDQKMVVKELYAVSTGDTLFINTSLQELATGYAYAICEGRYVAFYSGFKDKKKGQVMSAAMALAHSGFIFAIPFVINAVLANAKSAERHLIVIDTQTGTMSVCDRNFLLTIMRSFSDIEYQYAIEQEQNSEKVLVNYLKMVNIAIGN